MPELLAPPMPDPDDPHNPQRLFEVLDASDTHLHEAGHSAQEPPALSVPEELAIAEAMVSATPMTTHPPKERSPLDGALGSLGDGPHEAHRDANKAGLESPEPDHQHHAREHDAPELE